MRKVAIVAMKQFQEERNRLYQWDTFKFLMGTWKTEAAGFQVTQSLDGKVLVLSSNEPVMAAAAKKTKPANYKSLTYFYLEGLTQRATTFDNQGGVFTYNVETGPQKLALVATTPQPSRIVFQESQAGNVAIAVETAAGAAKTFKSQATVKAVRVSQ
jgi:hypothetical protein